MKKFLAIVLIAVMMMAMGTVAFAEAQGQGTLTVSNATKGQTYTAYKVFNAVYSDTSDISKGVVYTVPSTLEAQVSEPFSVGTAVASNGEKIVSLASGTTETAVLAWVKSNYTKFDSTGTALVYSDSAGTASATLDYGYYYVTSGLGSVVTIDSLNAAVSIVDKNASAPDGPTKLITAEDSSIIAGLDKTNVTLTSNDAAVDSVETFKVTFNAVNWVQAADDDTAADSATPNNNTKVTNWVLTDTPVGLNIDSTTVAITVNGTALASTAFSVSGGGTAALNITIPWTNDGGASLYAASTAGSALIPVVVTYNATVTDAAAIAAATNTVVVKYNTDTPLGTATTTTNTYKFQLDKTKNAEKDYAELTGAKFQLYASDGTTLLKFAVNGTTYTYDAEGKVDTIDMTSNAKVVIQGLDKAGYVLKETQAPSGYNKAEDVTIADTALVIATGTITDNTGVDSDTGVVTVVNEAGTELPSTGGIGTTIFYIVGSILVLGAAVILITRRRMNHE